MSTVNSNGDEIKEIPCEVKFNFEFKVIDGLNEKELESEYKRATEYAEACLDSGEQWKVYQYADRIGELLKIAKVLRPKIRRNRKLNIDFFDAPTVSVMRYLEPIS